MCNTAAMKSSKQRAGQVLPHCQWHMQASGAIFYVQPQDLTDLIRSFAEKLIKATKGEKGIVEPTFVYLPGVAGGDAVLKETGVEYFSVPVELGVCPKI